MGRLFCVIAAAAVVAVVAGAAPAQSPDRGADQPPGSGEARFSFHRVDDGFLRLDSRTGEVASCGRRGGAWTCLLVPDERAAVDGEIARLQGENARLKSALLDHGVALPQAVLPQATPPAPVPPQTVPPTAEPGRRDDVDRVLTLVERMWRRLVELMNGIQRDMKKT